MKRFNWPLCSGFLLSVAAFFSYIFFFVRFPITRDEEIRGQPGFQ